MERLLHVISYVCFKDENWVLHLIQQLSMTQIESWILFFFFNLNCWIKKIILVLKKKTIELHPLWVVLFLLVFWFFFFLNLLNWIKVLLYLNKINFWKIVHKLKRWKKALDKRKLTTGLVLVFFLVV